MSTFGFFHSTSMGLVNLLERTELFGVSQEIREQLVLALSDLVTLVASVATHFHKAISGMTTDSTSIDIYEVFSIQIHTFTDRCEKISESMWRHQLLRENFEGEKGMDPLAKISPLLTQVRKYSRSSLSGPGSCLKTGP